MNGISQSAIARELGDSQTVVSMALNGRQEYCSAQSYRMIWALAIKRGYRGVGINHDALGLVLRKRRGK